MAAWQHLPFLLLNADNEKIIKTKNKFYYIHHSLMWAHCPTTSEKRLSCSMTGEVGRRCSGLVTSTSSRGTPEELQVEEVLVTSTSK